MASLLIKNAAAIVTCDAADTVYENAGLLIEDGAITYMGPEDRAAEETLDARGCIVIARIVNAEDLLCQNCSR